MDNELVSKGFRNWDSIVRDVIVTLLGLPALLGGLAIDIGRGDFDFTTTKAWTEEWRKSGGRATAALTGSYEYGQGGQQSGANLVSATSNVKVTEIVKFLNTQGDVKSISSPRVMTLNNQPALISVGKELFYKLKSSTTGSGGTGVGGGGVAEGETVDSVFAGILLDITPEIDANGMITLKINPSISDTIDDVESGPGIIARDIPPDLIRRQIASVIKVKDGEHAILGGLIFTRTGVKINKVPLLGDLPLLEYAFKHEEKINKVEELVMIVTPHIIKSSKSVSLKDLGYSKVNEK